MIVKDDNLVTQPFLLINISDSMDSVRILEIDLLKTKL